MSRNQSISATALALRSFFSPFYSGQNQVLSQLLNYTKGNIILKMCLDADHKKHGPKEELDLQGSQEP